MGMASVGVTTATIAKLEAMLEAAAHPLLARVNPSTLRKRGASEAHKAIVVVAEGGTGKKSIDSKGREPPIAAAMSYPCAANHRSAGLP